MTKFATGIALVAAVLSFPASAQTVQIRTLDQAGAERVLQAAKQSARKHNAPSAIAAVDFAGELLAFERMDDVRLASTQLAIDKARTAARLQRATQEVEDNINNGRTAFVTAGIMSLRGGMPVVVDGKVVGAVGVAGRSKETDVDIAKEAADAVGSQSDASKP